MHTRLAQAGTRRDGATGALATPIYQCASFAHSELGQSSGFDYSRTSNPTRLALEETLATIDEGHRAFAFASGMAAIDAVMRIFAGGSALIVTEDLYGGTFRLCNQVLAAQGIEIIYADTSNPRAVAEIFERQKVDGVFGESLTNPLLKVADVRAIATLAQRHGALTIIDNTFLTPVCLQPLKLGADLVVYSASKYLGGHNDLVAGAVVAAAPELAERIAFMQNSVGAILGPQDAWLTLRGLKTLALRMARHQQSALKVANWLQQHPRVRRVYYPGLSTHPGHQILGRTANGYGGMVSFEVSDAARVPYILANVEVFLFAESLGGVESLITFPVRQTHADIDAAICQRLGINQHLLRLSIGIESADDLIADLERVL